MDSQKDSQLFERYEKLFRRFKPILQFTGLDIMREDYKVDWKTILAMVVVNGQLLSFIYLIVTEFDPKRFLAGAPLIIIFQGVWKSFSFIKDRKKFISLRNLIHDVYKTNEDIYPDDLLRRSEFVKKLSFGIFAGFCVGFTEHMALPWAVYLITNLRVTTFPLHIPGFDIRNSTFNWIFTCFCQSWMLIYTVIPIFLSDILFLTLSTHSIILVDLLGKKFENMTEIDSTDGKMIGKLKDCVKMHQDYSKYVDLVNRSYASITLIEMLTSSLCVAITLYITVAEHFLIGPIISLLTYSMVVLYSLNGTVVEIQNERLANIIYSSTWYNMRIREQKIILLMLAKSQNPVQLYVGKFVPLNVETCQRMTKMIYAFLMAIINLARD